MTQNRELALSATLALSISAILTGCPASGTPAPTPSSAPAATVTGYQVASTNFPQLTAPAGSAVAMTVYETMSDGSTASLPAGATVTWSGASGTITASDSQPANPVVPVSSTDPYAVFVSNPGRPDHATDLSGVLFLLYPGTGSSHAVTVNAAIGGATSGKATGTVTIQAMPTGDATHGGQLFTGTYANGGANCASCHGMTGQGGPAGPDADGKYSLPWNNLEPGAATSSANEYPYQAPGLNNTSPGGAPNLAADPSWNAAILAMAARADMDNYGVTLRAPMPDWLTVPIHVNGQYQTMTAQDFADLYAWLLTQKQ